MIKIKHVIVLFSLLFTLSFSTLNAQFAFTNQTNLLQNNNIHSGSPIAVADMNGDFLDDIIRFDNTTELTIDYQQSNGTFLEYYYGNVTEDAWAICVADINNDGFCEVMAGGYYNGVQILKANGIADYTYSQINGPNIFVQGSHFVDFNNDGHLDLFACHDDGPSNIWMNDGNGNLVYDDSVIDLAIFSGVENNAGNYGVVWTDVDNDNDLDMYISKCRSGVENTSDSRRINQLWVNDGNNNYTEQAADYGLAIGYQTWTAEFQDIDNDGDMDCFLTNHDFQSQLFENVNNFFIDITATSGINMLGAPIQAALKDFDNDGFVDLIASGVLYKNNGDKTFSRTNSNPLGSDLNSFGIGDLNHDGFLDVYACYGEGINFTGSTPDKLLINNGNDNHFFAVNLIGQESNRNGIGARIELYGAWGVMVREVRAGESYGIGHSFTQHFGLGTQTNIDSLIIKWPSGTKDIYDDVEPDMFATILEGECITPIINLNTVGGPTLCTGESMTISAPQGYSYNWSNGANTSSITVDEAGVYNVTVDDGSSCISVSNSIVVVVNPVEELNIVLEGDSTFCEGTDVTLHATDANSYLWSTGDTTQSITITEGGTYSLEAEGTCNTLTTSPIVLNTKASPDLPMVNDLNLTEASSAILNATGNDPHWYNEPIEGHLLATGNSFITPFLSETTVYYVADVVNYDLAETTQLGEVEHTGLSDYSGNQYNGEMIFDAYESFVLKSTKVYTDTPGNRVVELKEEDGTVLQSKIVNLIEGDTVIQLDFKVPVGNNLILSTNGASNQVNFGYASPRLRRTSISTNGSVNYPYVIDNIAAIKTTNLGLDFYYYFYDWSIELPPLMCASERIPLTVSIGDPTSIIHLDDTDIIKVYPNPTDGDLVIEMNTATTFELRLIDLRGQVLHTEKISSLLANNTYRLSLSDWSSGVYWIQFVDDKNTYTTKVILH